MGLIHEWYGYLATDQSRVAADSATNLACPFLRDKCQKKGGVCSVAPSAGAPVPICPIRMYFDRFRVLREIASEVFAEYEPLLDKDDLPRLIPGAGAVAEASRSGHSTVAVFGKGWGGEIKLPPALPEGGRYSIDFVMVLVLPSGGIARILPIEVQTIDTTGSHVASRQALITSRRVVPSQFGMNWENVNKRILPQLIAKGLMLQGERLCNHGIFFLTPNPVFKKIMLRLGGQGRFREIPRQPGSITFIRLDYGVPGVEGAPVDLIKEPHVTISTSDLSLAFITPENLPPAGSYEKLVLKRLHRD